MGIEAADATGTPARLRIRVEGAVQGVGFRPFVYRLAGELGLTGRVGNDNDGVLVEVEGAAPALAAFRKRLEAEPPPLARIERVRSDTVPSRGEDGFHIVASGADSAPRTLVLADAATCTDCLDEVSDPANRRAGYPFTNCTNCGPRFSIVRRLPYDRARTTMARFTMCARCQAEYDDPGDRRFHAQPNACPECGPRLSLVDADGQQVGGERSLECAVEHLRAGGIVALKGIGGFLLLADAGSDDAVARLRDRKRRPRKPLALLVSSVGAASRIAEVDEAAAAVLTGPVAPIVLLPRRPDAPIADAVAPGMDRLGVMLPSSPLHHLLARAFDAPLVATSGNRSDEPIAIDNQEARIRLAGIADLFLEHDRPIQRHVDDSVTQVFRGAPQVLRRARGLAPLPVRVSRVPRPVLAVGAHFKNSVALALEESVFISQHIGDMETPEALGAFEAVIEDFLELYDTEPAAIAHDLHPDYASSQWADRAASTTPRVPVQHHHAHLAGCLAEHRVEGPALGVVWDGTGLGTDGTIWGGEFLLGDASGYARVAHLRPFRLPGGDAAARDPWRSACGVLHEIGRTTEPTFGGIPAAAALPASARHTLLRMLDRNLNSPVTSSCGRLFDAVAALVGVGDDVTYEGEAAIRLEHLGRSAPPRPYEFGLRTIPAPEAPLADDVGERGVAQLLELDWEPLLVAILDDVHRGHDATAIAAGFHHALAAGVAQVVEASGAARVALSGGCFQNCTLQEQTIARLEARGIDVLLHRQVPMNDGGISLGQAVVAAHRLENDEDWLRQGAGGPAGGET